MNWFEPSRSFTSAQMFPNYPFQLNALSQSMQRPPVPNTHGINHSNLIQAQNIPHALLSGPTKRVRHTHSNFTEITPKLEEFSHVPQTGLPLMKERESADNNVIVLHKAAEKDLIIPPLNGLSLMQLQQLRADPQQQIWQQLQRQQQSFNNFMQHQLAQQIEHQKLEFGQMMYRMHEAYRIQSAAAQEKIFANVPELQINHMQAQRMMNLNKLIELGGPNFTSQNLKAEKSPEVSVNDSTEIKASDEDDYQYVKLEELKERASDESTECQGSSRRSSAKTEEDKAKISQMVSKTMTKQEPKKKRGQGYSRNYFAVFEENLTRKNREGPRRKNKWQTITGEPETEQEGVQPEQPLIKMVVEQEAVEIAPAPQKVKPVRVPEIPQYLQDDSLIDYKAMLATTITNDPALTGTEDNAFVVIQKEATSPDTRVGDKYQAAIPELRKKGEKGVKGRKRCPEVAWKPGCINENEMKKYYDDLCRILKCEDVNEERALKLLKRKNFKKEKVKVNITKNEKFYASFLIVTNNITLDNDETIKGNTSQ